MLSQKENTLTETEILRQEEKLRILHVLTSDQLNIWRLVLVLQKWGPVNILDWLRIEKEVPRIR